MIEIRDCTQKYNGKKYYKYINRVLRFVPENDLINISIINMIDECSSHFCVILNGEHYPSTNNTGATVDIFIDQAYSLTG